MVDVVSLASATVAFLAVKGSEGFVQKIGEEAFNKFIKLRDFICEKLNGANSRELLDDLDKSPNDGDIQAALRVHLKRLMNNDKRFADQLHEIIQDIDNQHGDQIRQNLKVSGDNNKVVQISKATGNRIDI